MTKIISHDRAQTWSCDAPVARTSNLYMRFEHWMNLQKMNKNHTSYTHYTELLGVSNVAKCNLYGMHGQMTINKTKTKEAPNRT